LDFALYELFNLIKFIKPDLFEDYPKLRQYMDNVASLPGLKEYLATPDNITKTLTFNNKFASINNNTEYKLTYFKLYARGEPSRMLLSHSGCIWEDNEIEFSQWPALKPNVPGNQLPCLELKQNGKKMGQSVAILRFLAMQHGYYPSDPLLAHKANELIDGFGDFFSKVSGPPFNPDMDTTEIFGKHVPDFLAIVEKHISA
jgi:glutathione S-transferase